MRPTVRALAVGLCVMLAARRTSALVIAFDPDQMAPPRSAPEGSGAPAPSAPVAGEPQAPTVVKVEARAAKTEVGVGERFIVEVKATGPAGTSFTFPGEIVTEGVELHTDAPAAGEGSPAPVVPGVHRYLATVFELTGAKVPPVTVKYRLAGGGDGEASSDPVEVKVVSRLPKDGDPQKIADVRGPLALTIGPAFWAAIGAVILGLLALAVWLIRRRRSAEPVATPAAPPIDPATEAREALASLIATGLLARGDHRGFYIALTTIAKRYLERRLGAPVLEMTTSEMVAFLRDSRPASSQVGPLCDLAGAADRIKFARGAGLTAEAERHTEAVRTMIATVEAAMAPLPAPAAERVA